MASKVPNHADFLSGLIAKACINSVPEVATHFDIDNIRVQHILGSAIEDSLFFTVLKMMVGNNLTDLQLQQLVDRTIIKADLVPA